MDAIIKTTDLNNIIGTSFWNDTINASVNELINILHIEPIMGFDDKTTFEWFLEYHSETMNKTFPFTIYDYKENWDQYLDNSGGINDYIYNTKINWHIGGKSSDDTNLAKIWIKNKLNKFIK